MTERGGRQNIQRNKKKKKEGRPDQTLTTAAENYFISEKVELLNLVRKTVCRRTIQNKVFQKGPAEH